MGNELLNYELLTNKNWSNSKPVVTVVTCVYNRADKINRVFRSMNAQTFKNIEHIIVDDGSTDEIQQVVDIYMNSTDIPVAFVRKQNGGKHTATNIAWMMARGEYTINLDSDDELLPEALQHLVNLWESIPYKEKSDYWCVQARCKDQIKGEMIGSPYPSDINDIPTIEERNSVVAKYPGEKIGLQRTELMRKHFFPEYKGVNFVVENVVWGKLNKKYKTLYSNEIVRIYYINEGGNLAAPKKNKQFVINNCFTEWYKLVHRNDYAPSFQEHIKRIFKYSIYFRLIKDEDKRNLSYDKFDTITKLICGMCIPVSYFASKVYQRRIVID